MGVVSTAEIDHVILERLVEDVGREPVADIVSTYLVDSARLIALLRQAVKVGNTIDMKVATHQLKSTSQALGVVTVARLAGALEIAGAAGDAIHLDDVEALADAFERAKAALAEHAIA